MAKLAFFSIPNFWAKLSWRSQTCRMNLPFHCKFVLSTKPNLILLTVVNGRHVFPHTINNFVTRSIPVQDGRKWLLVNITDQWGQTCGWVMQKCKQMIKNIFIYLEHPVQIGIITYQILCFPCGCSLQSWTYENGRQSLQSWCRGHWSWDLRGWWLCPFPQLHKVPAWPCPHGVHGQYVLLRNIFLR